MWSELCAKVWISSLFMGSQNHLEREGLMSRNEQGKNFWWYLQIKTWRTTDSGDCTQLHAKQYAKNIHVHTTPTSMWDKINIYTHPVLNHSECGEVRVEKSRPNRVKLLNPTSNKGFTKKYFQIYVKHSCADWLIPCDDRPWSKFCTLKCFVCDLVI